MKRMLALLMTAAMTLALCACGSGEAPTATTPEEDPAIEVKGCFLLEPSDELDLSADGLASVQRYFLVVYDVENDNDANEELSTFGESVTVTFNDANTYEQLYTSDGNVLKAFRANCGYAVSTGYGTLWGGSDPVRMVAAFAINGNDVKEDCTAEIVFELSDNLSAKAAIAAEDIQTIHWLDGIFAVESDPNAYQIAHSVANRAQICKNAMEAASLANKNGNVQVRDAQLALCATIFSEEAAWGVSCGGASVGSDLPVFNVESVRSYYPEIADQIITISESIEVMMTELEATSPNYDNVNTAQRTAYNTLGEVLAAFDSN